MSKIRVLLVDDHAILRAGLQRLLSEEEDIEIVGEAGDGREAIQKVQELHPDIVLMDIGMPVMNGMEATKQIKKRDQEVKILVLTMHDNEEYLFRVLQAGAAGYVLKKAADSDLVNAIHVVDGGDCFLYPSAAKLIVEDYLDKVKHGQEPTTSYDTLTDREREILTLVAEGYTNREIAESLFISVKTVETHKANIMEKLNLHKRAELVRYAIRKGMLQVDFDEVME